jgi:hypothetical protein
LTVDDALKSASERVEELFEKEQGKGKIKKEK